MGDDPDSTFYHRRDADANRLHPGNDVPVGYRKNRFDITVMGGWLAAHFIFLLQGQTRLSFFVTATSAALLRFQIHSH